MGAGRRRYTVWRGVGRFRTEAGSMAHRDRRSRARSGASGLSRYPQRPRTAGTGAYPVALGIEWLASAEPIHARTNALDRSRPLTGWSVQIETPKLLPAWQQGEELDQKAGRPATDGDSRG